MSADFMLYSAEGLEESDFAALFSSTMGSRYFQPDTRQDWVPRYHAAKRKFTRGPEAWIGEVSWLKAALAENVERYVPGPVDRVAELVPEGDGPVLLTDDLAEALLAAVGLSNSTTYRVTDGDELRAFIDECRGKPIFSLTV